VAGLEAQLAVLRQALAEATGSLGEMHPLALAVRRDLAAAVAGSGDTEAAFALYGEVLEGSVWALGPRHPDTLDAKIALATLLDRTGEAPAARALLAETLADAVESGGPLGPGTGAAAASLGRILARDGDVAMGTFMLKLSAAQAVGGGPDRPSAGGGALRAAPELPRGPGRGFVPEPELRLRELAELLARQGRAGEALAALALLKNLELRSLDPSYIAPERPGTGAGGAGTDSGGAVSDDHDPDGPDAWLFAGGPDGEAWKAYLATAAQKFSLSSELAALEARRAAGGLAPYDQIRLAAVPEQLEGARAGFADFLGKLPELVDGDVARAVLPPPSTPPAWLGAVQGLLGGPGGGTALVCALAGEGGLVLITVTPGSVIVRETGTGRAELTRLALEFREAAADPARDPRPEAARLYDALIRPVEADLEAAGTGPLLLSLDGELRYAPLAALWDGERWLAEKYPLALFTGWDALGRSGRPGRAWTSPASASSPGPDRGQRTGQGTGPEQDQDAGLSQDADQGCEPGQNQDAVLGQEPGQEAGRNLGTARGREDDQRQDAAQGQEPARGQETGQSLGQEAARGRGPGQSQEACQDQEPGLRLEADRSQSQEADQSRGPGQGQAAGQVRVPGQEAGRNRGAAQDQAPGQSQASGQGRGAGEGGGPETGRAQGTDRGTGQMPVASPEGAHGNLGRRLMPAGKLTRESLSAALAELPDGRAIFTDAPLRMDPASLADSSILLADGGKLSLRAMRAGTALSGTDLVAFEGTDFSQGIARGDGREAEALGEILLGAGAASVLAALTPADTGAASELAGALFRLRFDEGMGMAEALREAQLTVMRDVGGAPARRPEPVEAATGEGSSGAGHTDGGAGTGTGQVTGTLPGTVHGTETGPDSGTAAGQRTGARTADGQPTAVREGNQSNAQERGRASGEEPPSAQRWDGRGFSHPAFWAQFVVMGSWR
jgi:CHAT domain-containing protein